MLDDDEFTATGAPIEALREKKTQEGASSDSAHVNYRESNGVLSEVHIQILNDFCNYIRLYNLSSDIRMVLPDYMFTLLMGQGSENLLDRLKLLPYDDNGEHNNHGRFGRKLALRSTQGPTESCIGFHVDGRIENCTNTAERRLCWW